MINMERRRYARNRIEAFRKERGLSMEQLGLAMGAELTGSTISKLEKGYQALSADYLLDMARVLRVDPIELLLDRGASARMVPVLGNVSAGTWRESIAMANHFIPIPAEIKGNNLFIVRPDGDSMNRIAFGPDSFIVVNPDDRDLVDGKYFVLMNAEGECVFKQFNASKMQLMPCSDNPVHQPIPVGSEPLVVVGRVVFAGQEF